MPLLATIPNFTPGPWRAGYVFPEALHTLIATIQARHRGNVVRRKKADMDYWSLSRVLRFGVGSSPDSHILSRP